MKSINKFLLLGVILVGVYASSIQAAILVNHWSFNGNLNDTSGNNNNGTLVGNASSFVPGVFGGQGLYIAATDSVTNTSAVGLPVAANSDFSLNVWVYLTNNPVSLAYLAGFGPNLSSAGTGTARALIAYGGVGNVGIYSWGSSVDLATGDLYPFSQWIMVTITHSGATGITTIYTNAVQVTNAAKTYAAIPAANVNKITVNAPCWSATDRFNGIIDEFTIWSGVLGSNDIAGLYATNGVPLIPPSIVTAPNSFAAYVGEYGSVSVSGGNIGPFTYQWLENGANLLGQTNAVLAFNPIVPTNAGSYTVIIRNAYGSITSSPPAVVTVLPVTNITTALAAYWTFYEANGFVVNDVSGNGNNGQMIGFVGDGSERVSGQIGQALHFRGATTEDYVQITNCNVVPPRTMTISGWVYVDSNVVYTAESWNTIVKNWPGSSNLLFHFGLSASSGEDSCYAGIPPGTGDVGPVIETSQMPEGQWIHVAFTADGTNLNIYRNGVPHGTPLAYGGTLNTNLYIDPSGNASTMALGVKLGANDLPASSAPGFWQGSMDDLAIWNRSLSAAEIYSIYLAGEQGKPMTNAAAFANIIFPLITAAPQPATRYQGENAVQFSVGAEGAGTLFYQWTTNGVAVAGATNTVLNLPGPFATPGATSVQVTVTDTGTTNIITSTPVAFTVLPVTNITTALGAYWTFYEPNGLVVNDVSGNGNNGQMYGFIGDGSERVPGQVGQALHFRGQLFGDFIEITNCDIAPPATMTIAGWMYVESVSTWASIVKNWPGASFNINDEVHFGASGTTGELSCYVGNASDVQIGPVIENTVMPIGQWIHVAFTADGTNLNIYRNGALNATPLPYGGTLSTNIYMDPNDNGYADTMSIGVKLQAPMTPAASVPGWWQGSMDDLAIWNRALSPAEILSIYVAGKAGQPMTNAGAYANVVLPIITYQPTAVTRYQGEYNAQFSVVAAGLGTVSYQWATNGVAVSGATNNVLTLPGPFTTPGAVSIQVTVTDTGTTNIVTSPPVALTVIPVTAITEGLSAHWTLNQSSGYIALDSTTNGREGALINYSSDPSQWVSGQIGQALAFDGASQFVWVTNYVEPANNTLTISAWVYSTNESSLASIIDSYGQDVIGQFRFGFSSAVPPTLTGGVISQGDLYTAATDGNAFPTNTWQNVALVADGANIRLYRNGILVSSATYPGNILYPSGVTNLIIGARIADDGSDSDLNTTPGYWGGNMDDVGMWTRGLTATEINAIYIAGQAGKPLDQASETISMSITQSGGKVNLSWPAGTLQSANSPAGPWSDVIGATAPSYQVTPIGSAKFYRIHP